MAKMFKLCGMLVVLVTLSVLPAMAEEVIDPMFEPAPEPGPAPAPIPTTEPGPAPAPIPEPAPAPAPEPAAQNDNDAGKLQQAQMYESQGKINQALILYLQATAGNGAQGYDAQLAAQAAYGAGNLFMVNKNDASKAAKLFHFAFAVAHYQDSALRAGEAYRALQNWAMACKLFRWGAVDSRDGAVKNRCNSAFADAYAKFEQSQAPAAAPAGR